MSFLATMQAELGYYADMLRWTIQDGIIKAVPKRKLSLKAHQIIEKTLKKHGGGSVSRDGSHYFELVLKPRQLSPCSKIAKAYMELMTNGIFEGEL